MLTMNGAEYAELRGRTRAWVSGMIKKGMPVLAAGRPGRECQIEPGHAIDWEIAQARAGRKQEKTETQRDRLAKEQADKVAIENAVRRGELAKVAHFRAVATAAVSYLSSELDGIAGRLANELAGISDPAEIRQRLLAQHRDARATFAQRLAKLGESCATGAGPSTAGDAAEESDAEPVG